MHMDGGHHRGCRRSRFRLARPCERLPLLPWRGLLCFAGDVAGELVQGEDDHRHDRAGRGEGKPGSKVEQEQDDIHLRDLCR